MKSLSILITGASGYLGTELTQQFLKEDNFQLLLLSSKKEELRTRHATNSAVSVFSVEELDSVVQNNAIDIVIHCAFSRSFDGESLSSSLAFTKEVLDSLTKNPCKGFINISSRSVYGQNEDTPWTEKTKVSPNGLYAMAKYATEMVTNTYKANFAVTNLRLAGLNQPELKARITNKFVAQVKNGKDLHITGGSQEFSFLNTKDAASGIKSFVKNTAASNWESSYNLGSEETLNILQLANLVIEVGKELNYTSSKVHLEENDQSLIDRMDSHLFYKHSKWKPNISMRQTITEIYINNE